MNLSNKTVEQLRKTGYKVRIRHSRYVSWNDENNSLQYSMFSLSKVRELKGNNKLLLVDGRGGLTEVAVRTPEGKEFNGQAKCNLNDSFNYRIGVKISLGRLTESV